jgi:hypothetical protein
LEGSAAGPKQNAAALLPETEQIPPATTIFAPQYAPGKNQAGCRPGLRGFPPRDMLATWIVTAHAGKT